MEIIKSMEVIPFESLTKQTFTYIHSPKYIELMQKAYDFAVKKHEGQVRKSGEPYVNHVINVAITLAKLQVSPDVIISGLLHDVIEDSGVSGKELEEMFNDEVKTIVSAVSKLRNLPEIDDDEYQAANQRKIFIAMSKDIRVILVKLADRLHNMMTLEYMPDHKQTKIAKETLNVYAPIAHRLGLGEIKAELEDRSLYFLDREKYFDIAQLVELKKKERDEMVENMTKAIDTLLVSNNIIVNISGRSKHLYSIYKKMMYKNKKFDEIYDLQAIRIICKDAMECYGVLGIIHNNFRPIPGRFKDYIAMKKPNMYQSLHTSIIGNDGAIFEIQIRTQEMDDIAEKGFAAHWRYKEGSDKISRKDIEEQLHWFRDFVSLSDEAEGVKAQDYMHNLQQDIFEANVYALTPKGKVISLPKNASVIDFAYKIHTNVAEQMVGARVNGNFVPFNTKVKTGDVVEIQTQNNASGPTEGWLEIVKTSNARQRIKHFLKNKNEEYMKELKDKGKTSLLFHIKERDLDPKEYRRKENIVRALKYYKLTDFDDLLIGIAQQKYDVNNVIDHLYNIRALFSLPKLLKKSPTTKSKIKQRHTDSRIIVEGVDSVAVELAKCCNPIPGDSIVGYVASGKAIKVHRKDCHNSKKLDRNSFVSVRWDPEASIGKHYDVDIYVKGYDRMYLLSDIVTTLSQANSMIISMDSNIVDLEAVMHLKIRVNNGEHLNNILINLRKIDSVVAVQRLEK